MLPGAHIGGCDWKQSQVPLRPPPCRLRCSCSVKCIGVMECEDVSAATVSVSRLVVVGVVPSRRSPESPVWSVARCRPSRCRRLLSVASSSRGCVSFVARSRPSLVGLTRSCQRHIPLCRECLSVPASVAVLSLVVVARVARPDGRLRGDNETDIPRTTSATDNTDDNATTSARRAAERATTGDGRRRLTLGTAT